MTKGFTLVELMVVLSVIAILAGVAIPAFMQWLPNMRLKSAVRDLYGAAMLAKGEAVKRNKWCALSFNQNIGGTNQAYVVFEDTNRNCEYDGGEPILRSMPTWPTQVFLDVSRGGGAGFTFLNNDNGHPTIVFRPTSIPTDNSGGLASGSTFLKSSTGRQAAVVISQAGNISIQ